MASNEMSFREIVAELQRLCMNKSSGTYLVMCNDGALFQAGLRDGEIVRLFFRGKSDIEALSHIGSIVSGVPRFSEGPTLAGRLPLPSTQEILDYLGASSGLSRSSAPTFAKASAPKLSASTRKVLEEELTKLIGPFAAIVCAEHLGSASDLEDALSVLSSELHNAGQPAQFRKNVLSRLGAT